jgi:hypothetical protein
VNTKLQVAAAGKMKLFMQPLTLSQMKMHASSPFSRDTIESFDSILKKPLECTALFPLEFSSRFTNTTTKAKNNFHAHRSGEHDDDEKSGENSYGVKSSVIGENENDRSSFTHISSHRRELVCVPIRDIQYQHS